MLEMLVERALHLIQCLWSKISQDVFPTKLSSLPLKRDIYALILTQVLILFLSHHMVLTFRA